MEGAEMEMARHSDDMVVLHADVGRTTESLKTARGNIASFPQGAMTGKPDEEDLLVRFE